MSAKKKATGAKAKARTNAKPDSNLKRGARGKVRGSSKTATAAKPGTGSKKDATALAKTRSRPKSGKMETAIRKNMKDISVKIESMAAPGSPERVAAGVAAVAGGALLAGATLGAGPAALAGAAGYLAYQGLKSPETKKDRAASKKNRVESNKSGAGSTPRKRKG